MDWAVALYIIPWFSEGLGEGLVLLDLPNGGGEGGEAVLLVHAVHPEIEPTRSRLRG